MYGAGRARCEQKRKKNAVKYIYSDNTRLLRRKEKRKSRETRTFSMGAAALGVGLIFFFFLLRPDNAQT